ncbi:unnamed protein product, partial [Symbiodinium pilosum]
VGDALPSGGFKYITAVVAPNGKLYMPPFDAQQALEFDPATAQWRFLGPRFEEGGQRYVTAVLANNGNIYALPCNAERILEINPLLGDARE